MVKSVIGEESQLKLLEDRLSQSSIFSQVGLVIGKLNHPTSDRGFVFDLVPTPPNDAGDSPCSIIEIEKKKTSSKAVAAKSSQSDSSSSLLIDKDWVAEHARQVSRMLLGGMKVVGIYVWANESAFKNSTIVLCQTVKGVADAASLMEIDLDERLLIHISYSPRRWTCRNCSLASNITSSSLRPCDFKMGRVLTSFQTFRCMYNFDVRFPIYCENGSNIKRFTDSLRQVVSNHAKELNGAKALIDGKLVNGDEQCIIDGQHEVEFLFPFMQDTSLEACSQKEVVGVLVFRGSLCSFAFSNSKEPLSQALADIKGDIITSLKSRLDILCDEADRESDSVADGDTEANAEVSSDIPIPQYDLQQLRKACSLSFPRRVFIPWLTGTYICDYIHPSETIEVIKDHCVELMSMEAPTDIAAILEPEAESTDLLIPNESFWERTMPSSKSTLSSDIKSTLSSDMSRTIPSSGSEGESSKSVNFNVMAALLVLILSVVIGLVLVIR